jgi:hypothetical protein
LAISTATLAACTTGATTGAAAATTVLAPSVTVLAADWTKPTGLMSMQMPQQWPELAALR